MHQTEPEQAGRTALPPRLGIGAKVGPRTFADPGRHWKRGLRVALDGDAGTAARTGFCRVQNMRAPAIGHTLA
eukprot:5151195-Alexandrium_andersonii.AAC.1